MDHTFYRDDMYTVWAGVEKYVRRVVNEFYASDAAVAADKRLQGVARDLGADGAHIRGACAAGSIVNPHSARCACVVAVAE